METNFSYHNTEQSCVKRGYKTMDRKTFQRAHDKALIASTGRVMAEPYFTPSGDMAMPEAKHAIESSGTSPKKLFKPTSCYVCKTLYFELHHFYHRLCPCCAKENYEQRTASSDLSGRVALVTGGRIKIGFEIALKLLQSGAEVIVTTRFKNDAARRYAQEHDFDQWQSRLTIQALDLRHIPSIEHFTDYLNEKVNALDIIINNAAQTLRKPEAYYAEMALREQKTLHHTEQGLLGQFADTYVIDEHLKALSYEQDNAQNRLSKTNSSSVVNTNTVKLDEFNEPVDCSAKNTWLTTLEHVDTLELIETQVVNAMAPFLLNSRLKPLMMRSKFERKFIINVSAMEGQFNRTHKTHRHPHTNMAKAALNMMTRTSAQDYVRDGIYMNSVDTGWVTQENPLPVKIKSRSNGMVPPLDCIDGAARVLAPVFSGVGSDEALFGEFLKDYRPTEW